MKSKRKNWLKDEKSRHKQRKRHKCKRRWGQKETDRSKELVGKKIESRSGETERQRDRQELRDAETERRYSPMR